MSGPQGDRIEGVDTPGSAPNSGRVVTVQGEATGVPMPTVMRYVDIASGAIINVTGRGAGPQVMGRPITSVLTVLGGANAAATLTIGASGAGLFHYITYLHISRVATAALAGGALLQVTTTNLPNANVWRTGNAMAAGGYVVLVDTEFFYPLRSSVANTATTIVCPAPGAAVHWNIVAHVFTDT